MDKIYLEPTDIIDSDSKPIVEHAGGWHTSIIQCSFCICLAPNIKDLSFSMFKKEG
jgi:hypothetical protein